MFETFKSLTKPYSAKRTSSFHQPDAEKSKLIAILTSDQNQLFDPNHRELLMGICHPSNKIYPRPTTVGFSKQTMIELDWNPSEPMVSMAIRETIHWLGTCPQLCFKMKQIWWRIRKWVGDCINQSWIRMLSSMLWKQRINNLRNFGI